MKLVLLSGKAGCGKTTIGEMISANLNARRYKCVNANFADLVKYICRNFCGWNGEKDDKGRRLLQFVGTDVVRADNPNYWVKFIADMIKYFGDTFDYMIISDCRFPNEIEYFKERDINNLDDVIAVRIEREKQTFCNISAENSKHSSENALDDYQGFDLKVLNQENEAFIAANKIIEYIL